jgi:DNA-binding transcriptional LysR family regulator
MLRSGPLSTFHECFPAADFEMIVRGNEGGDSPNKRVDFEVDYLERVPPEMVRRDLAVEDFCAYAAPFHQLGQQTRISVSDLRRNLLVFQDRWIFESFLRQLGGGEGDLRKWILPDPRVSIDLARQGQGIVFLPKWAAGASVREGSLARLKLPGIRLQRTCCAWWEPSRPLTWVAEVFLGLFADDAEQGGDSD